MIIIKRTYISILFLLQASYSFSQNAISGYHISGIIHGIDSGMIRMLSSNGNTIMDSSAIVNGVFLMQGNKGAPEQLLFNISPGNWNFKAFVEDAQIKMVIDTTGATHHGSGKDRWALIWDIAETGSSLSDVYTAFKTETRQAYYYSIFKGLNKKLDGIQKDIAAATVVKNEMDSIRNLVNTLQKTWIEKYIHQHPSSIAGTYLLYEHYQLSPGMTLAYIDSMLHQFSAPVWSSIYYKELSAIAINLRNRQNKELAPDFSLLKKDKTKFTLSSARGEYILLDFWASWCLPCRQAIPGWKKVYAAYRHKGFNIVSISNDRNWGDWIKALRKEQMPWIQVIDEFPAEGEGAVVAKLYEIEPLPFYVLIDKEGKLVVSSNEEKIIRTKLDEVFR